MRIAIFADIHGKILLPFKLVDLYQKETGKPIDLILQCGDIGAFPDLSKLDKATLRHARRDKEELGFHYDFMNEKQSIKTFLDELDLKMICVRGNHEDHEYLDALEAESNATLFPIDVYEKVWVCKTGYLQTFTKNDEELTFVGVGRVGDRKGRTHPKYIQDYERQKLKQLHRTKQTFDILITHDSIGLRNDDYGMTELRTLLDNVVFNYHFYGHTGEPYYTELDENGFTQSTKIKELEYDASGILPKGSMIIFEKDVEGNCKIEVVSQDLTNRLQKFNWKYS